MLLGVSHGCVRVLHDYWPWLDARDTDIALQLWLLQRLCTAVALCAHSPLITVVRFYGVRPGCTQPISCNDEFARQ